jgi:hypothetical protein
MKIITVWQARKSDGGGTREWPDGVYDMFSEAKNESDFSQRPYERRALVMEDGRVWLLEGEPTEFTGIAKAKRDAALAKLTPEERAILGLK